MTDYFFYHDPAQTGIRGEGHGQRTCRVKSIGPKWVRLQINISRNGIFHRIKRKVWNEIIKQNRFRTIEKAQTEINFCNAINDAGIVWSTSYRGKPKFKTRSVLKAELENFNTVNEWQEAA